MEQLNTPPKLPKPYRPTGVALLTIYALLFAGVFPFLVALFFLIRPDSSVSAFFSPFSLISGLLLNIGIVIFGIGTWQGKEKARIVFMILVSLNYLLIGINNFRVLRSGVIPSDGQTQYLARIIQGVVVPATYLIYFNNDMVKTFFHSK